MGGKAFGFEAKRMDKHEYEDVLALNLARIDSSQAYKGMGRGVVSYSTKESFGDIDILVLNRFSFDAFWDKHKFRYKDYKKNGGVISLLDKQNRQIDIIKTPLEIYNIHYNYLAYNDMGNFIGRIARVLNLKYGHDGLSLVVRHKEDSTRKIGIIKVSTDVRYIYDLLDIAYRCYDTMEQIFRDIMSSKYYHRDSFLLEKQSHHARVRDSKRKSYRGMLDYIKENDKSDKPRRNYTIHETLAMLPDDITLEYNKIIAEHDKKLYEKTLYNGNIVSKLTGLNGIELGRFMATIKDNIDVHADVKEQVLDMFKGYQQRT
jgi:hypothetical protein